MKEIVAATNNKGKLKEIKAILTDYKILSLEDVNCDLKVKEDKTSFEENSLKKAKEISEYVKMPCIADDSGLCITKYNGWPGVLTARFMGEAATPRQRNEYILEKMKDLKKDERDADVVCSITYYDSNNGTIITKTGIVHGKIAENIRGTNGFGFDEIFELPDGKTLAELSEIEKNTVSARKIALDKIKKDIDEI